MPSALAEIQCDVCAFYYDERMHFHAKLEQRKWADAAMEAAKQVGEEQRVKDSEAHYEATGRVKF